MRSSRRGAPVAGAVHLARREHGGAHDRVDVGPRPFAGAGGGRRAHRVGPGRLRRRLGGRGRVRRRLRGRDARHRLELRPQDGRSGPRVRADRTDAHQGHVRDAADLRQQRPDEARRRPRVGVHALVGREDADPHAGPGARVLRRHPDHRRRRGLLPAAPHRDEGQPLVPARRRHRGEEGRQHGGVDQRDAERGPAVHPAQPGAVGRQLEGRHGQRRHHRREGRRREVPQRRFRGLRPVRAEVARRGQPGRADQEPEVQRPGQAGLRHRRHPQRQSRHPGAQRPEGRFPGRVGPLGRPGQEPEHGQGHRHQRAVRLHDLPAAQPGRRGLARHQQPPVRRGGEEGHRLLRAAGCGGHGRRATSRDHPVVDRGDAARRRTR